MPEEKKLARTRMFYSGGALISKWIREDRKILQTSEDIGPWPSKNVAFWVAFIVNLNKHLIFSHFILMVERWKYE